MLIRITVRDHPCPSASLTQLRLAGSRKRLYLPGSHGHIFPWDPPFGAPNNVLRSLAATLRDETVRLAIDNAAQKVTRSEQSSPASQSDSDERPEFHPIVTDPIGHEN